MPTLAIIAGISVLMWPNDHDPPRFAGRRGKFDIATGRMIEETRDRKAIKKVQAWTMSNQAMLSQAWNNLRQQTMTTKS